MRKEFGYGTGKCETCKHLIKNTYDRTYYKCAVYGSSASESTDWKISEYACGLKDKSEEEVKKYRPIVQLVERVPKQKGEQIEGQLKLF